MESKNNIKAIIPVAGAGTNLRPHTFTQPKPLIPVAGKPIIAFIIDQLIGAGVGQFVLIIGYLGEKIRKYVEARYPDVELEFVYQETRQGLGHAIWSARDTLKGVDEVVIILGDTIVDVNYNEFFGIPHSCLGVKKVQDPRQFGVVQLNAQNVVQSVIEKPSIPKSNLAIVGLYKIKEVELLLECIDRNIRQEKRTHGEYQLTDGIQCMIEKGVHFTTLEVSNWFDCGKKEILLETNAMMLSRPEFVQTANRKYPNTILVPPVSIGEHCEIANSIIGPNVSVGNHSRLNYAIITNSIVGSYASIDKVVLEQSIIGNDAVISGQKQNLNIGDNTEIDLG